MKKLILGFFGFLLLFIFSVSGFSETKKKEKKSSVKQEKPADREYPADIPSAEVTPAIPPTASSGSWSEKFEAGWKKGLYFKTKDGNYSLKFRGRIQPQFYYTNLSNKPANNTDQTSFTIKRANLSWEGNVFTKSLDYKLQLNVATTKLDELLEEAWLDYRFYNPLRVQVGQYQVPYIRQYITSSGRLQFVDRALASMDFRFNTFDVASTTSCVVTGITVLCPPGTAGSSTTTTLTPRRFFYDDGVMIHGDAWNNKLEYYTSITNGSGFNRVNPNKDLLYIGRVVWNPVGQYGYQESDVDYSEHPSITVGASGGYMKRDFDLTKLTQSGFELGAKYRGFSFQGEGFFRDNNPVGINAYQDVGYYAQAGYIFKKHFEIAGRVSQEFLGGQGSNNTPGSKPNNKSEFTGGFNYYIFQHDLKLQADYSYLTTQTDKSYGTTGDHRLRVQLQAWF